MIFPPFDYKVRLYQGEQQIFDIIRNKYVVITPEEWVRQHLVHYLINKLNYPKGLIAVEKQVPLNGLNRRFDLVCYKRDGSVFLLVECKKSGVKLTQQVFDQAFCYNTELCAIHVAITNGNELLCGTFNDGKIVLSSALPQYAEQSCE